MRDEPIVRWEWIASHLDDVVGRTLEHVWLTLLAVTIGFALSFALSLLIVRWRRLYGPVTAASGILYTIPSLALFALLVPFTGLTVVTAQIALVGYTLLVLVRNIVAGLDAVPAEILEAADAMGYSRPSRLLRVELPLAVPVIVAGLRIATVTTIGLVTVSALIGQGGLGFFIEDGIRRRFPTMILVGAVVSVALAIVAEVVLLALQRLATPWARRRGGATAP